jgi:hypothetical protein
MVAEPFFSVPAAVTPIVQGNVVVEPIVDSLMIMGATSIIGSPMVEINEEESIFQEPIANHKEEQQQPLMQNVSHNEPPRKSQRARK